MPRGPHNKRSSRYERNSLQYYYILYRSAVFKGIGATAKLFDVDRATVRYWQRKFQDEEFHSGLYGGARYYKWQGEELDILRNAIWLILQENPLVGLDDIRRNLVQQYNFAPNEVPSPSWLSREFSRWRWSFTKPDYRQVNKYTTQNIEYYALFLDRIQDIPWEKIKFADESHLDSKDLRKKLALSPIGDTTQILVPGQINKRYTLTLLTTLSGPLPVVISFRETSNTAEAFLEYVLWLLENKHLSNGDYLIIDNAPVHTAEETLQEIVDLLEVFQIKLIFLPTYSPELNPCELCFGFIKRKVRETLSNKSLVDRVVDACSNITVDQLINYYDKCIIQSLFDE